MEKSLHVVRRDDHIAVVTFDRPKHNLFVYEVYDEFRDVFGELSEDDSVAAVILTHAGKDFSMGHEMAQLQKVGSDNIDEHYRIVGDGLAAVYLCNKPTVAAVRGYVAGAGMAAAAACDVIIAAQNTQFMVPEIKAGIVGATEFLELILPKGLARYYAYTGKTIPAYDLYRTGGIFELTEPARLMSRAEELAADLATAAPPELLRSYKAYMNGIDGNDLKQKFHSGKEYGKKFVGTPNCAELYAAFFEKRPPKYSF